MCPDIETFAPLISAAFGPGAHPAQALPVRLADRALRQVNPLLDTVARLLELADRPAHRRAGARPARRRARCAGGSASTTATSTGCASSPSASGVRWGLDAAHRRPLPAGGVRAEHLGRRGSIGCCSASPCPAGRRRAGWAPRCRCARSSPGDTARVGRLAEFVDRLAGRARRAVRRAAADRLDGRRSTRALELLTDTTPPRPGRTGRPGPSSPRRRTSPGPHADTVPLGLADVRSLLAERLRGRPTRAGLPHRHAHRGHAGADALGAAPRGLPARARRRGVPARRRARRRRRAGPRPAGRRARRPQRGPPAAARRDLRGHRARSSSCTPGPTSAPAPARPPAVPLGELLDAIEAEPGRR